MKHLTFKQRYLIMLVVIAVMNGCGKQDNSDGNKIGEYVYIDRYNCIHTKQNCVNLLLSGAENGEEPRYMVSRVEIKNLNTIGKTCSSCVTDEAFKELKRRVENR